MQYPPLGQDVRARRPRVYLQVVEAARRSSTLPAQPCGMYIIFLVPRYAPRHLLSYTDDSPANLPVCGFHFIYNDLDDQAPFTRVGCAKVPNPIRYYRTTTGSRSSTRIATTRSSASRTTSRTTSRISSTSGIGSTTLETPTTAATSSENPTSSETDSIADDVNEPLPQPPASLAWIAGPIVGGIAGLVIIGLLVWIIKLLRRRSAARQDAAITPAGPQQSAQVEKFVAASPNPTASQPSPAPPYTSPRPSQWTYSAELPATRVSSPPTELAGSRQWGNELSGDAVRRG